MQIDFSLVVELIILWYVCLMTSKKGNTLWNGFRRFQYNNVLSESTCTCSIDLAVVFGIMRAKYVSESCYLQVGF